ncbi:hypothetical protein GPJ56_010780 [Histomonas meleagridis]|uniref:uncharacterized protein n=1 Tax=Histomonas meleagridis TaxID=135588 RepID=UPI00355A9BB0|nr:hypothetical protein GPJ56_010780 [Histomonas meleagridis]KAH0801117.1 hypothetical protein GO595_006152 [Histomonas meleagridis]
MGKKSQGNRKNSFSPSSGNNIDYQTFDRSFQRILEACIRNNQSEVNIGLPGNSLCGIVCDTDYGEVPFPNVDFLERDVLNINRSSSEDDLPGSETDNRRDKPS